VGPETRRILLGVRAMGASGPVFPAMGGFAKLPGQDYPSLQVSWARAFGLAPANVLSPFQHAQIIGAVLVGWLVFGEWPDAFVWTGAAIIIGAGVAIGWGEARRTRPAA
jgi:drug/metabolite transporter (DMT)-like permease